MKVEKEKGRPEKKIATFMDLESMEKKSKQGEEVSSYRVAAEKPSPENRINANLP